MLIPFTVSCTRVLTSVTARRAWVTTSRACELRGAAPTCVTAPSDGYGAGRLLPTLWAEADLIVADQFRDGNVPAKQETADLLPDGVRGATRDGYHALLPR